MQPIRNISSMSAASEQCDIGWRILLWIARLAGLAAIVPLMQILFGEWETGPSSVQGWIYLALFPVGFSIGYLVGWRWPLVGDCISLVCMAASLLVLNKTLGWGLYLIWGLLCVPGVLYIIAGWKLRRSGAHGDNPLMV